MRVRKKGKEIRMTFERGLVVYWMQLKQVIVKRRKFNFYENLKILKFMFCASFDRLWFRKGCLFIKS